MSSEPSSSADATATFIHDSAKKSGDSFWPARLRNTFKSVSFSKAQAAPQTDRDRVKTSLADSSGELTMQRYWKLRADFVAEMQVRWTSFQIYSSI